MLIHEVMRQLFALFLIACSSMNGMDNPPFTIKFADNREEQIELPIVHMFPNLQNLYNQGTHEVTTQLPLRSVRLALEMARLKTKVNEEVPLNKVIAQYKLALRDYSDEERYAAGGFAEAAGNAKLAELIVSLTQEMNIPKEKASEPTEQPLPQSSAMVQPAEPAEQQSIVLQNPVQQTFTIEHAEAADTNIKIKEGRFKFLDMLKERSKITEGTTKKVVLKEENFLDIGVIKLFNDVIDTIEKEKTTDIEVLQTKFLKQYPQDLTAADFNALIEHTDALDLKAEYIPVIKALTEAIWAERLIENPTPINLKPDDLKVGYDVDRTVAKIMMERALTKKYEIKLALVPTSSLDENEQDLYERTGSDRGFLCPTVSTNNISMIFNKSNNYVLVNRDYNYYFPLSVKIKVVNSQIVHADVSSDGKCVVMFFKDSTNGIGKIGTAQKTPDSKKLRLNIFDLPAAWDADGSRVIFKKDSQTCFIRLLDHNKIGHLYTYNAALPMSNTNALVPTNIDLIPDPWIHEFFFGKSPLDECRGMLQTDVPFFNLKSLHGLFFNSLYFESFKKQLAACLKSQMTDIEVPWVRCVADSCVHYAFIHNKKNKTYGAAKLDFNPDSRLNPLLAFMNKKYESVKNSTADSYALYPNALYIVLTYLADWYINPTKLRTQMGGLYQLVDPELKKLVEPHIYKEHKFDLARYLIYQKYQPYAGNIKVGINGVKSGIKYGLGTLWWAAKWGVFGYFAYHAAMMAMKSSVGRDRHYRAY